MSILVTCYHGTTLESASQVLDEGFIPTTGNEDWLGHGIYFFEASVHLGWIYARKDVGRAREKGYSAEPALLAAEIDLTDCIDLCDPKWAPRIRDIVAKMTDARLIERQHGLVLKTASGRSVVVADYDMPMDTFRRIRSDCSILNAL